MAEARRRWFCRWRRLGPVEPQHEVSTARPISAGGGLNDIHPMRRGGVKSFVDDLVLGRGVVISRAATSLRSVETQPLTRRFVRTRRATISVSKSKASQLLARWRCRRIVFSFLSVMRVRIPPRAINTFGTRLTFGSGYSIRPVTHH